MPTYAREDNFRVTVQVTGGPGAFGTTGVIFDTLSGGNVESEPTKYRPGGMGKQIILGNPKEISDITVGVIYDDFLHAAVKPLTNVTGRARMTIRVDQLDAEKNTKGSGITYTGVLTGIQPPEHDSEGNNAARLELTMAVDEP